LAPNYSLYNLGNNQPEQLGALISTLETTLRKQAVKRMLPMQAGDVKATYADIALSERELHFAPTTPLADGIGKFVAWYCAYYHADQ
jgi:UDP-glucuronate 4-epimerase